MSAQGSAVWPKGHRVEDERGSRRYEVTGLWTSSVPGFVEGCVDGGRAYIEHRGDRTFVVVE